MFHKKCMQADFCFLQSLNLKLSLSMENMVEFPNNRKHEKLFYMFYEKYALCKLKKKPLALIISAERSKVY